PLFLSFSFYSSRAHRDLHSFPTRRSSDLVLEAEFDRRLVAHLDELFQLRLEQLADFLAGLVGRLPPVGQFGGLQDLANFRVGVRSEEHTSELQSLAYLVCRLLLEKKKKKT